MLRCQQETQKPRNLKQWQQKLTSLTCDANNKEMSVKMMTMNTVEKTLSGTGDCDDELDETTNTGDPTDDQNFFGNLMAIRQTLMRPHLECMLQQVAVFKKHVSFCRVESARSYFPVVGIGAFWMASLSRPLIECLQSLVAKARKARGKGNPHLWMGGKPSNLGTLGILPKPQSRSESRPPMSKKRPIEVGATRGGPHHAPRLRLDQCMLRRQVGHRASECPNKGKAICTLTWQTGVWCPCSGLCSVRFPVLWCDCGRNWGR